MNLYNKKLKIYLTSIDNDLTDAWKKICNDIECVSIYHGSIIDLNCDAVVSPGNSFGFMDGGIDLLYSQYFGWRIQEKLQKIIKLKHDGELLVGKAEIIKTKNNKIPWLISAPTMRIPMSLHNSVNPYLAARASLLLIEKGMFSEGNLKGKKISTIIKSVAFPGLGTGCGEVDPNVCAKQIRVAIDEIYYKNSKFPESWIKAQERHQQLLL